MGLLLLLLLLLLLVHPIHDAYSSLHDFAVGAGVGKACCASHPVL